MTQQISYTTPKGAAIVSTLVSERMHLRMQYPDLYGPFWRVEIVWDGGVETEIFDNQQANALDIVAEAARRIIEINNWGPEYSYTRAAATPHTFTVLNCIPTPCGTGKFERANTFTIKSVRFISEIFVSR